MYLCDIFESFKKREEVEKEGKWRTILLGASKCLYYLDGYCILPLQFIYTLGDRSPITFMRKCEGKCEHYRPRKEVRECKSIS